MKIVHRSSWYLKQQFYQIYIQKSFYLILLHTTDNYTPDKKNSRHVLLWVGIPFCLPNSVERQREQSHIKYENCLSRALHPHCYPNISLIFKMSIWKSYVNVLWRLQCFNRIGSICWSLIPLSLFPLFIYSFIISGKDFVSGQSMLLLTYFSFVMWNGMLVLIPQGIHSYKKYIMTFFKANTSVVLPEVGTLKYNIIVKLGILRGWITICTYSRSNYKLASRDLTFFLTFRVVFLYWRTVAVFLSCPAFLSVSLFVCLFVSRFPY